MLVWINAPNGCVPENLPKVPPVTLSNIPAPLVGTPAPVPVGLVAGFDGKSVELNPDTIDRTQGVGANAEPECATKAIAGKRHIAQIG